MLLIAVALARVPMPWMHDHALLTPEALALHMQTHHAACPDGDLPRGVHFHVDTLDAVVDGSKVIDVTPTGVDARCDDSRDLATATVGNAASSVVLLPARSRGDLAWRRLAAPSAGCDLFLQYGALRI